MPKQNVEIVTVKEFATRLGVTSPAVVRHIKAGRITDRSIQYSAGGKPKIIVQNALEDLRRNADIAKPRHTRTGFSVAGLAAPKIKNTLPTDKKAKKNVKDIASKVAREQGADIYKKKHKIEAEGGIVLDFSRDPVTMNEARIREAIAKSVKEELGVQALRKTLVNKADQDLQLANLATNLKKDLSILADRISDRLATETSPTECRNIVHAELEKIMDKHSGPNRVWQKGT
jgi:hypothetical protein